LGNPGTTSLTEFGEDTDIKGDDGEGKSQTQTIKKFGGLEPPAMKGMIVGASAL
jgi:hypothetical protein